MVDPFQLGFDVLETTVSVATAPLLWLFLFLLAWEDPDAARAAGFGRRTFWLLLPGALLGSVVNLPFFAWSGDVLALNVGGGLVPLVVSLLVLRRTFPGRDADDRALFLGLTLVAFAAASGAQLAAVWTVASPSWLALAVLGLGLAPVLALVGAGRLASPPRRAAVDHAAVLLALTEAAVLLTFLTTQTVPALGIVSQFPAYLVAPLLLGAFAGGVVPFVVGGGERSGLAFAYASVTFGVLVGADLLRQPPLYGPGSTAIYAIGGAGTDDLLYLSGLLALAAAYAIAVVVRRTERAGPPAPSPAGARTSAQWLRRSLLGAVDGRPSASVADADRAVSAAFLQARQLSGLQPPSGGGAAGELEGLPLAPWVEADRRNLAALAASATEEPYDATRAWMTARWLVRFARGIGQRRLASWGPRSLAYLLDLAILGAPAILLFYAIVATSGGTVTELLGSVALNAALFGFIAYALVLLTVTETVWGATPGKYLLGLRVTDRRLGRPGPVAALLRNLPKVVTISVVGYLGILIVLVAERGTAISVSTGGFLDTVVSIATLALLLLLPGLGIPGGISLALIAGSSERQRLGDLFAGTWVVRATPVPRAPQAPPGAAWSS